MISRYRHSVGRFDKQVVEFSGRTNSGIRGVDRESKDEDRDEEDSCVRVIRDECTSQPTCNDVGSDDERDEEALEVLGVSIASFPMS